LPPWLWNWRSSRGFHIGKGSGFIYFTSMMKADVVIMTTPGLQSLTLKRSPGVGHYIHVVHSPTGMGFYKKNSFDYFDTVMCAGPHQISDLRKLEKIRGSQEKTLLKTGCLYMDLLKNELDTQQTFTKNIDPENATVLIAPTWGPNGALQRYGMEIIKPLLDFGYNLILRPHPQQYRSEQNLLKTIKKECEKTGKVTWDDNPSGHESMNRSDIMVSDLSGVIFDFTFVYGKPVITLEYPLDSAGFEQEDLKGPVWEIEVSKSLGGVLNNENIGTITELIENRIRNKDISNDIIRFRDEALYNYGVSGIIAVDQLLEIAENV